MDDAEFYYARTLAELLRVQRWAGGDSVPADRIFGLMHGFESVLRQERESFGIAKETQEKVEGLLEDIEAGYQSTDGHAIKGRLRRDGIDEMDASRVIQLCRLQSRFTAKKRGQDSFASMSPDPFSSPRGKTRGESPAGSS